MSRVFGTEALAESLVVVAVDAQFSRDIAIAFFCPDYLAPKEDER
jgi:hypothetical protein